MVGHNLPNRTVSIHFVEGRFAKALPEPAPNSSVLSVLVLNAKRVGVDPGTDQRH